MSNKPTKEKPLPKPCGNCNRIHKTPSTPCDLTLIGRGHYEKKS